MYCMKYIIIQINKFIVHIINIIKVITIIFDVKSLSMPFLLKMLHRNIIIKMNVPDNIYAYTPSINNSNSRI